MAHYSKIHLHSDRQCAACQPPRACIYYTTKTHNPGSQANKHIVGVASLHHQIIRTFISPPSVKGGCPRSRRSLCTQYLWMRRQRSAFLSVIASTPRCAGTRSMPGLSSLLVGRQRCAGCIFEMPHCSYGQPLSEHGHLLLKGTVFHGTKQYCKRMLPSEPN